MLSAEHSGHPVDPRQPTTGVRYGAPVTVAMLVTITAGAAVAGALIPALANGAQWVFVLGGTALVAHTAECAGVGGQTAKLLRAWRREE